MAKADITLARVREVIHYNPESGIVTWIKPSGRRVKPGDVCDTKHEAGYFVVSIDGARYMLHRLIFFYMTGRWPAADLDHRDGNRVNNAWANLREATRSQNLENLASARSHNKLGVLGVFVDKRNGKRGAGTKYVARIVVNGKRKHLGTFPSIEEAQAVYQQAKRLHHFVP